MNKEDIILKHNAIVNIVRKNLFFINPIFSSILYQMNWRIDFDAPKDAFAYVAFTDKNSDDISANSIFFSPILFENPKFNDKNYIFILLHEILHKISGHNSRKGARDPILWNLATDHTINTLLKNCENEYNKIKNIRPVDQKDDTTDTYIDGWKTVFIDENIKENLSAEEIYEIFAKEKNRFSFKNISNDSDQNNWIEITDNKTGKKYIINNNKLSNKDLDLEKNIQSECRERFRQLKDRGLKSNTLYEYLENILRVELPWEVIIKHAIHKYSILLPNRRSWYNPNKKYRCHNIILPGKHFSHEENKIGTCIISIDTSASISKNDLEKFTGVIIDSFNYFKDIIIITHDTIIHQLKSFNTDSISEFVDFVKNIGLQGRGGTSHKDVFDKIEEIMNDQFTDLSMYISLTDGYSDIEQEWKLHLWSSYNKIPTYFIITKDGKLLNSFEYTYDTVNQKNPRQIKIKN